MLPFIDEDALRRHLSMTDAIDALEAFLRKGPLPDVPQRTQTRTPEGELLLMPAWSDANVGVKLVTVNPSNPGRGKPLIHGVYVLFSADLEPVAVIDGAALTGMRTAAVSGLATRFMARTDARALVIFGAGTQGRWHLEAMRAVRSIEAVRIVSRTRLRGEGLVQIAKSVGLEASVGPPSVVAEADIVCTCTTSPTPLFDGSLVRPGTHLNAVGAYKPDERELDDAAVAHARIVVETRDAALTEAGDLLIPISTGVIDRSAISADLHQLVHGAIVRLAPQDITIFKSVGVAFEDLAVATALVTSAL